MVYTHAPVKIADEEDIYFFTMCGSSCMFGYMKKNSRTMKLERNHGLD